jgi:regulator of RNase E activity RraA
MSEAPLSAAELAELAKIDTPTVCNALELVAPERRADGFTFKPLVCPFPDLPPIVGYARTAIIRATHRSTFSKAEDRALRLRYYRQFEEGPRPTVAVIQDMDGPLIGFGAFWGEVQTTIHKGLGCKGVVTDGCVRDIDMMAPGFQVLAGSLAPSHAWVHLVAIGGTVNVGGMVVSSGDLVHADRHGAVVIPHAVARKIVDAADLCARREAPILAAARKPGFTVADLERAMGEADDIH